MTIRILQGDCRDVLPTLPANGVHTVVTSPPYWNLRDYGTAQWGGGDAQCDHMQRAGQRQDVGRAQVDGFHGSSLVSELTAKPFVGECGKCGAKRIDSQLGLEATPDEYIQTMVAVFREVRRVLRPDGTCWVNMGDSYASASSAAFPSVSQSSALAGIASERYRKTLAGGHETGRSIDARSIGLKPKDLLLIPARLALALQQDGWWLRSDIIWAKPNPMPESVTDRPTSAHEHVFLLSKRSTYFYDASAVSEPSVIGEGAVRNITPGLKGVDGSRNDGDRFGVVNNGTRNLRNVWTIATAPFPDAHFATFPPELAERCIKAGTSERGCCAQCGKPWGRVMERKTYGGYTDHKGDMTAGMSQPQPGNLRGGAFYASYEAPTTTGWSPSCQCSAPTQPCTVLDPFAGAGTTGLVADRLQRDAVLIELSGAYCAMLRNRITNDAPLFAEVTT